jgi:hypothetical protein
MKKILLIVVIAFFVTELSYGQFALGIKLGYNASKLSTDLDSISSSFNSGFHVGVFSRFGKRLYLAPELQYTLSGSTLSTNEWKQKVTIGSVDVPVLVGFKIIHSDLITWRIELGPQASFLVNSKIKDINSVAGPINDASLNNVNWYVLAGTGIDILFLKLDVRYQYGLNQLIQDAGAYQLDTKGQMIVVSLGWKIFGKK